MARTARTYRNVETDLWFSEDFRGLSQARPSGQGLWQYLLTSPRTVAVPGIVVARPAVMADDLRWSRRAFDTHMREVIAAGMAEIDPDVGLVVLTKALIVDGRVRESARPTSTRAVKAWANALLRLRSCALRDAVVARVERVMTLIGGTFPSLFAEAMANPSTEDGECQGPSVDDSKDVSGNREQGTEIRISEVSLTAGARDEVRPEPAPPAVASATAPAIVPTRGRDLFATLAEELHDRHAEEARKLKVAIPGCANVSVGGGPLMGEGRTAVVDVVSRWAAEARELGADAREHITARMDHLVAVRAATARREKHLRWWTSGRFWRWAGIEIDLGQTVEQVRAAEKPREGARFAAERPAPAAAPAPNVAETTRTLEEQRAADRKAVAERAAVAAELARAKEGLGIVTDVAKKLGGQR